MVEYIIGTRLVDFQVMWQQQQACQQDPPKAGS